MARLDELFEVRNGLPSNRVDLLAERTATSIPYVRPAKTQLRTIAGWVEKSTVPSEHQYPQYSIFVSTNGEGSHTYAYVSDFEFVANSDVSVLIPKGDMSLAEKIFYARAITMNRQKFSYGRKPKGERLKKIVLPNSIPFWAKTSPSDEITGLSASVQSQKPSGLDITRWKPFKLGDLFDIRKGLRLTKADMLPGNTPYIGASDGNNGVTAYIGQSPIHKGNTISLSYDGSIGEAFYQPMPYWASDAVNTLYPKDFELTPAIGLFICTLIRQEKYRFSYGRKWTQERMRESIIKLPVTKHGKPDFDWMDQYIKNLPYSSQIMVVAP